MIWILKETHGYEHFSTENNSAELSRKLGVLGTEHGDLTTEISVGETMGFHWFHYPQCLDGVRKD